MKNLLKTVIRTLSIGIAIASFSTPAMAGTPPGKTGPRHALNADSMRFMFRDYDGNLEVECKHTLQSAGNPYDWQVECFNGANKFAEYTAHVSLTQYANTGPTQLSIELLYWLIGTNLPAEVGSTTWYHFATKSELQGISQSQTVEHGTAGLYLEIGAAAIRLSKWAR
jgi:hypothetical protein